MSFGQIIRKLRQDRGISQGKLAKLLDMTQQNISSYEQGKSQPTISLLIKCKDIFDVSIDYLLGLSPFQDKINLSTEQTELLQSYEELNDEQRQAVKELMKVLHNTINKKR